MYTIPLGDRTPKWDMCVRLHMPSDKNGTDDAESNEDHFVSALDVQTWVSPGGYNISHDDARQIMLTNASVDANDVDRRPVVLGPDINDDTTEVSGDA